MAGAGKMPAVVGGKMPIQAGAKVTVGGKGKAGKGKAKGGKGKGKAGGKKAPVSRSVRAGLQVKHPNRGFEFYPEFRYF